MQAFTNAVKGAFGYGPVFTEKPPAAPALVGAASHPPPRPVSGTEPQAGGEQGTDAVLRAQAGWRAPRCGPNRDLADRVPTTDGVVEQQP